ncbi:Similar to S.cerevisiae protein CCC2 (Cu(+2)-transporting P-type ATPase) [Malassezia sympodialis ATCC 42132]|uniref:P-type Cu(+) transporter n=1 Tax=Malassezia sympodialis (strain ATCC 42132) TaxID=1230383 RepID=A0A1M8AB21_MALS4|nr:Similar to S.cerevisiae protein CCC2 (Cu(+2)-transporting P-type ATPase) [Malassezia sympodialis ATCC 42132]
MGTVAHAGDAGTERVELHVKGMTCGSCVSSIETMLGQQSGIVSVSVALLAERAVVEFDAAQWTREKVAEAIEDIGFDAEVLEEARDNEVTLSVYGMTCASCTSSVERALRDVPGVTSVAVSLALQRAQVHFEHGTTSVRALVQAVEDAGFDAILFDDRDESQLSSLTRVREVQEWWQAFVSCLYFAVPAFLLHMVLSRLSFFHAVLHAQLLPGLYAQDLLALLLTLPVQFGIGWRFFRSAYKAFQHGTATMDTLVVLGTMASWTFSVVSMLLALHCSTRDTCKPPKTFFETSTMLITFVTLGRYLENAAKGRTSEALTRLMRMTPQKATIYEDDACTVERVVPVELLQVGDTVKLVPGERIAADGVVKHGESAVDESLITGEYVPVRKTPGSQLIGGTVNGTGTLDFVVTRAGKDTALSQIVTLVQDAQTSKAPIQAYADRVAGVFVPCILVLSLCTLLVWLTVAYVFPPTWQPHMLRSAQGKFMECMKLCISVIVVACPCALGLSTPTAVMVGTGVGASNGILIKSGSSLEAACSIAHVVFDKTGTLTRGELRVVDRWDAPDVPAGRTAALVHAVESRSEHVLAQALVQHCETLAGSLRGTVTVTDFEAVQGAGVRARGVCEGHTYAVHVGRESLHSTPLPPGAVAFREPHEARGCTMVYAWLDDALVAAFALADTIKPDAARAVELLHRMGMTCSIMTGDTVSTARAVAKEVGIPLAHVQAGLSPNGKLVLLHQEHVAPREPPATRWAALWAALVPEAPTGVAMVGDGVNDSPALAAADVGIALSSGSDIAMSAASIVLMRNQLMDVPIAFLLCQRIFQQIRLNYVWATMYNVVMIPIAMGVFLPWGIHMHPMMAGLAMTLSSVSVVLSSLSLKGWHRPDTSLELQEPTMFSTLRATLASFVGRRARQAEYLSLELA